MTESASDDNGEPADDPASHTGSNEGGATDGAADVIEEELSELELMARERDEFRAMVQQLQADFENYRKRVQREQAQLVERANERLLETLLPSLDSFELAGRGIEADDADVERLRGGVLAAIRQFEDALMKTGLEPIRAVGVAFDPTLHEAVMHDADGSGEPIVGEVLRSGFQLKGRVLRPAMVRVTQGGDPATGGEASGSERNTEAFSESSEA